MPPRATSCELPFAATRADSASFQNLNHMARAPHPTLVWGFRSQAQIYHPPPLSSFRPIPLLDRCVHSWAASSMALTSAQRDDSNATSAVWLLTWRSAIDRAVLGQDDLRRACHRVAIFAPQPCIRWILADPN